MEYIGKFWLKISIPPLFVIWWHVAWGWDYCLHLGRCSWALPQTTACFPLVTVFGSVLQGPVPLAVAFGGLATIFAARLSAYSAAVTLGSEIFTLGFDSAILGYGSATLGNGVAQRASGWVCNWFCCSFAFAAEAFADPIFVNSLLTLHSASAALVSAAMFPCRALVSQCAAWMTIFLGDSLGFVMYWCLKNTVSLILVARVLTI
jgi:hypothetical protein